jgi:pimeloyl-ACP methyl ester carboxylesterase
MQDDFEIRGHAVAIRGTDRANPAMLVLPGPGLATRRHAGFFAPWEADFTLVHWDQPAAAPLTFEGLAAEGAAVIEAACARLGQRQAGLLATSGGTVVALKLAKARPDLVSAYVGCGQVVNRAAQEVTSWRICLQRARAAGDAATAKLLAEAGPPPWSDIGVEMAKSLYANAPTAAEAAEWAAFAAAGDPAHDARAAAFGAYMAIRDELAAFDAEALGLDYAVPMAFLQGADDAHTTTPEVAAFAGRVRAPQVILELIPEAGHLSFFLREAMRERLARWVKPLLAGAG